MFMFLKLMYIYIVFDKKFDVVGFLFKVSKGIFHARGLLLKILEEVKFEKEGEHIFGIVNCFDSKEGNRYKLIAFRRRVKNFKSKKTINRFHTKSTSIFGIEKFFTKPVNSTLSKIYTFDFFKKFNFLNDKFNIDYKYISEKKINQVLIDPVQQSIDNINTKAYNHKLAVIGCLNKDQFAVAGSTITSTPYTRIFATQLKDSKSILLKNQINEILVPTSPVNKVFNEYQVRNLDIKIRLVYGKHMIKNDVLEKDMQEAMKYSINISEAKSKIFQHYKLVQNPRDNKYYFVQKNNIYVEYDFFTGKSVLHINFNDAKMADGRSISEYSYNIIQDSKILNMYERPFTEQDLKNITRIHDIFIND